MNASKLFILLKVWNQLMISFTVSMSMNVISLDKIQKQVNGNTDCHVNIIILYFGLGTSRELHQHKCEKVEM